jgi:hypothetical protein
MTKKKKIPDSYQIWIDARKRYSLSHAHIHMARELSMNPKKFGKKANHKQEPWKVPLPVFIEELYSKRFGKKRPDEIKSIEQLFKAQEKKKAERRARKQLREQNVAASKSDNNLTTHLS